MNIDGTPVFVHNTGKVVVRPEAASGSTNQGKQFTHNGRVACGSSCGPAGYGYAGTFGAIARKRTGNALFGLSNNHVFANCNHTPVGMPIMSPGGTDARPGVAPELICEHHEIVELRSGVPTLVTPCDCDVAIATIPNPQAVSSWQGDATGYDTPTQILPPQAGLRVQKFGRTTGLTHGTILAEDVRFTLPYKSRHFSALVWFSEVWTIEGDGGAPFALCGDSGSLVVNEDASAAVGLVFAVGPKGEFAYIIPIQRITAAFGGIALVGRHGI